MPILTSRIAAGIALLAAATASVCWSNSAVAAVCLGNCGTNEGIVDGSILPAPGNFGRYDWVSTYLGQNGAARIDDLSSSLATNGSELTSDPFFATVGQRVSFNFNYVTSDGAEFADYAFAQLINTTTNSVFSLFTARTQPTGVIAPGIDLPPVQSILTPAEVFIIPGAPSWSPLGPDSSGECFDAGCGYTGWIQSDFDIGEAGTYLLRFGVANWQDTEFDSGLAFSGLVLDGNIIGNGSSFESPLLPTEIDSATGAFEFEFTATPNDPVVIDPDVATGYTFESNVGILNAEWEDLGDTDGYDIFLLSDLANPIATGFLPGIGNLFDFTPFAAGGVLGFQLKGIDTALMLDPTDTTAFKTKLLLNVAGPTTVNITQTPITTFIGGGVPEPATWAMMLFGFGAAGGMMRYRRRKLSVTYA